MSIKKRLIYLASSLLSLLVLTATAFAINSISEGYRVGSTKTMITAQGICKGVTCTGGQDIFVPTNSANEWNAFINNAPSLGYVILGTCTTPPTGPQNLTATAGDQQVTLNWTAPTDNGGSAISGYNIYRSTVSGGGYVKVNTSIISATSYIDTGLTSGTFYYYKISAINSDGEGPQSSEISAKTFAYMSVKYTSAGSTANFTCTPYISGTTINYVSGSYPSKTEAIRATKRSLESCLSSAGTYTKKVVTYHTELSANYGYVDNGSCINTSRYGCTNYAFYALTSASYGNNNNFWHQDLSAIKRTDNGVNYVLNGTARFVDYKDRVYVNNAYVDDYPAEDIRLLTTKCVNAILPFNGGTSNCSIYDITIPTYSFR